jgi:hypothetical protein
MQKGRGGMGSHKHGVSGRAGKSPRLRLAMKMDAERNERRPRGKIVDAKDTVREVFHPPWKGQ